jgi:SAM-dependent methyltransferase
MVILETVACPACGANRCRKEFEAQDRFKIVPGQAYTIVRCEQCSLLFVNPRPDANSISAFYATDAYDPYAGNQAAITWTTRAFQLARKFTIPRKVHRALKGLNGAKTALDVGCATGEFAAALQNRGLQVCGAEPDPKAADLARKNFGLTVWTGTMDAIPENAGPFDLITMWHVLEHVHDLKGALKRVRGLLSERGRFVIAVPNPLSCDAQAYGTRWVAWEAPRHLYHFEPHVLLALLEREGFAARRAGAMAFDAYYHCLLSESNKSLGVFRASLYGTMSFMRGAFGGEGSSELYYAVRNP